MAGRIGLGCRAWLSRQNQITSLFASFASCPGGNCHALTLQLNRAHPPVHNNHGNASKSRHRHQQWGSHHSRHAQRYRPLSVRAAVALPSHPPRSAAHRHLPIDAPHGKRVQHNIAVKPQCALLRRPPIPPRRIRALVLCAEEEHLQRILCQAGLVLDDTRVRRLRHLPPWIWSGCQRETHPSGDAIWRRDNMVVLHDAVVLWAAAD